MFMILTTYGLVEEALKRDPFEEVDILDLIIPSLDR